MSWLTESRFIMEPNRHASADATVSTFENHWLQARAQMLDEGDAENALAVVSHMGQMISLFRYARPELDPEQRCKQFWIENKCVERALTWLLTVKNKGLILSREEDERLVMMLHSLCELAARDAAVIGYLNGSDSKNSFSGACCLASLLIEYSRSDYENDIVLGETARYSFILLMKLAKRYAGLESCLIHDEESGYSSLVISGISARYAQLPTHVRGISEQMRPFIQQLKFVDDICHSAPEQMTDAIARCFRLSFLETVVKAALFQEEGSRSLHTSYDPLLTSVYEEEAVVTYYLQTICDLITHPTLIKNVHHFIISMMPIFLQRISHSNVSISVSTLGLFNSMLSFYCEDFWFHAILKYLLPQSHRMVSQRKTKLPEIEFYDSSVRFLSLIPQTVIDAVGSETVSREYLQYLNSESKQLAVLDSMGFQILSTTGEVPGKDSNSAINNPVYRNWKLKYDGTDDVAVDQLNSVNISSRYSDSRLSDTVPVNGSAISARGDADSAVSDLNQSNNEAQDKLGFTNISLQQNGPNPASDDNFADPLSLRELPLSEVDPLNPSTKSKNEDSPSGASESEGYVSLSADQPTDSCNMSWCDKNVNYGPLLDSLLQLLKNWKSVDPDILLFVTDVVSLLARSRIPLVSSLILDTKLILQPSYSSFTSILNRIRADLDHDCKANPHVVTEIWGSLTRERKLSSSSLASSISNAGSDNGSISSVTSVTSISDKVMKGLAGFLGKIKSPGASVPQQIQNHHDSFGSVVETNSGYRYLNSPNAPMSSPGGGNTKTIDPTAQLMAKRAIFFTHWMLELAAISHQMCWKVH